MVEHVHGAALPWQDRPQAGQLLPRQGDHQPHLTLTLDMWCCGVQGHFQKNLRRAVMRYVNLSTILVYRLVSKKVIIGEIIGTAFSVVTKLTRAVDCRQICLAIMLGMLMWRETEIPHTFTDRQREKVTLPRPDIEEKMYKQAFSPDITMGRRIQRLIYRMSKDIYTRYSLTFIDLQGV